MFSKIKNLNRFFQIAIINTLVDLVIFLAMIPCFFVGYKEIPLGFALGTFLSTFLFILQGISDIQEEKKNGHTLTTVIIILRFALLIATIIGAAFLYYYAKIKIFNLFSLIGAYTISVLVLVFYFLKHKE